MKRILLQLLPVLLLSCSAQQRLVKDDRITISITHIQKVEDGYEVYGRKSYMVFAGLINKLPDTLRVGCKITLVFPHDSARLDTMKYNTFKRIK